MKILYRYSRDIKTQSHKWYFSFTILAIIVSSGFVGSTNAVAEVSGGSKLAEVLAQGNDVYVLWQNLSNMHSILFARSVDGGQTFGSPVVLVQNATLRISSAPQMSIAGNTIVIAWTDSLNPTGQNNIHIFLTKSNDGGRTFSNPVIVDDKDNTGFSTLNKLYSDGQNVYVIYQNGDFTKISKLFLLKSDNNGNTFSKPLLLSANYSNTDNNIYRPYSPSIVASGNNVYVAWLEWQVKGPQFDFLPKPFNIVFRESNDSGNSFGKQLILGSGNATAALYSSPQLALSNDSKQLYVSWIDLCDFKCYKVFFVRSTDGGHSFQNVVDVNAGRYGNFTSFNLNSSPPIYPYIGTSGGNTVFMMWQDAYNSTTGRNSLILARSFNGGDTFDIKQIKDNLINESSISSHIPSQFIVNGTNLYLTWFGSTTAINDRVTFPISYTLFFQKSDDSGSSFASPVDLSNGKTLFSNPSQIDSKLSSLLISNNRIYAIWQNNDSSQRSISIRMSADSGSTFNLMTSFNFDSSSSAPEFPIEILTMGLLSTAIGIALAATKYLTKQIGR